MGSEGGSDACSSPRTTTTTTTTSKSKAAEITTSNKGGPKNAIHKPVTKPESKVTPVKTMKAANNRARISKAKVEEKEEKPVETTISDAVEKVEEETTLSDTNPVSVPMAAASNEVSVHG